MCADSNTCRITAVQAGQRLDVAVGLLFPEASARARRRLWDTHSILVNGKARPCGFMVRAGDELCVRPQLESVATQELPFQAWLAGEQPPHIVAEQQNLIFVYKPSGLHTAHLAGRGGPSLEAQLPDLLPDPLPSSLPDPLSDLLPPASPAAHAMQGNGGQPDIGDTAPAEQPPQAAPALQAVRTEQTVRLVNRLDCGTSGLVVAARDASCAAQWQRMENAGLCEKHYLTLLCGRLETPLVVRNNLDVDSRRVTRVLPTESTQPLRHSRFTPLGTLSAAALQVLCAALYAPHMEPSHWLTPPAGAPCRRAHSVYTVALCTIAKGARHQIRAHASHAGFPLWGDSLYTALHNTHEAQDTTGTQAALNPQGPTISPATPPPGYHFLLHHGRLVLSGAVIQCLPVWFPLLPPDIQTAVQDAWPAPA